MLVLNAAHSIPQFFAYFIYHHSAGLVVGSRQGTQRRHNLEAAKPPELEHNK